MEIKSRFDHFNINVTNLERSIAFYEKAAYSAHFSFLFTNPQSLLLLLNLFLLSFFFYRMILLCEELKREKTKLYLCVGGFVFLNNKR